MHSKKCSLAATISSDPEYILLSANWANASGDAHLRIRRLMLGAFSSSWPAVW